MAHPLLILDQQRARKQLFNALSPRYRLLDRLEAYTECRQYEGRDKFRDACDTPLRERAPSINYPIVELAIESNADLILGEGRWPEVTSFSDEDDRELDPDFGLNEDDSKVIDGTIRKAIQQTRFVALITETISAAQSCGTGVIVFGIRRGKLIGETVRAKWCTPVFSDEDPTIVESIEIRYPYLDQYWDKARGAWAERCLWYRRTIDTEWDRQYLPVEATDDGTDPTWSEDKKRTRRHALGFCPVRWYPFMRPIANANQIDGVAVHDNRFELIDSLNIALSQKDRAAFYSGDPQMVETGVSKDEDPADMGRTVQATGGGYSPKDRRGQGGQVQAARRRGASTIWTYRDKDAKVSYLVLDGDALKALDDNARDLRAKLQEALKIVVLDPEHAKHAAEFSNKAIRTLLKRQLAHCDKIRQDAGDNLLIPSIAMLLRIAYVVNRRKPGSVYLPGIKKAMPVLERFEREIESDIEGESTVSSWFDPHIDLKWGPYFEPDPQEENLIVQSVVAAHEGKIITRKTAISRLPESFGIENADQYDEALAKEEEAAQKHQMDLAHAMTKLAGDDDETDGGGAKKGPFGGGDKSSGGAKAKTQTRVRASDDSVVAGKP